MLYYVLVSDQGLEVRFSKNQVLPDIRELLGLDIEVKDKAFLEITEHQFVDKSLVILSKDAADGEVNFVTKKGRELRGLLLILGMDTNEKFFLISATQVKSVIPQLLRRYD
jgi:F0F1-type ATP synthase beta subunit